MSLQSAASPAKGCALCMSIDFRFVVKIFVERIHADVSADRRDERQEEGKPVDPAGLRISSPEPDQGAGRRQDEERHAHGSQELFPVVHRRSFVNYRLSHYEPNICFQIGGVKTKQTFNYL